MKTAAEWADFGDHLQEHLNHLRNTYAPGRWRWMAEAAEAHLTSAINDVRDVVREMAFEEFKASRRKAPRGA